MRRLAAVLSIAISVSVPAAATAETPALDEVPRIFQPYLQRGVEDAVTNIAQQMMSIHPDGIINRQTVKLHAQMVLAQRRANMMGSLLRTDLDFDGFITGEEIESVSAFRQSNPRERIALQLLYAEGDSDGDGKLSLDEIRADVVAKSESDSARMRGGIQPDDFLFFDMDGDGEVTIVEMARAVRAIREKQ